MDGNIDLEFDLYELQVFKIRPLMDGNVGVGLLGRCCCSPLKSDH